MFIINYNYIGRFKKYGNKKPKKNKKNKLLKKLYYLKFLIKIILVIVFYIISRTLLKKYLIQKKIEEEQRNNTKNYETYFFNYYQSLKNVSYKNDSLFSEYKNIIFQSLSEHAKKTISSIENIYFDFYYKFGNMLISLNKVIFYC